MSWFSRWWRGNAPEPPPSVIAARRESMRISERAIMGLQVFARDLGAIGTFASYEPPPGVLPSNVTANDVAMASDYDVPGAMAFAAASGFDHEGLRFPGFPYLAELTQRPEYRKLAETYSREMTRKWIRFVGKDDDDDKSERIQELEEEMKRLQVRDRFRSMVELDGFFGRGHLFVDLGHDDDDPELTKPLIVDKRKIAKGSLKGLNVVEPIWTYPAAYNASKPLKADFYKPSAWYVMGKQVHSSRLLTFISREMPNILKPAYAFAGLSLSQMAKPYVDNWLRTRKSVSDTINAFSVMVLATNMADALNEGSSEHIARRAHMFNLMRNNLDLMEIDKDTEELTNVSAPLGTLDHLQAQSQEQICSISSIPLVKYMGTTPTGLNASSEGEIRVWYDLNHALQEHLFGGGRLETVVHLAMMNIWGEIDTGIGWEFVQLWQLDEAAEAAVRKTDTDRDVQLVEGGVLSPEEVRQRLAKDPASGYHGLDVDDLPEPPEVDDPVLANPAKTAEPAREERNGV